LEIKLCTPMKKTQHTQEVDMIKILQVKLQTRVSNTLIIQVMTIIMLIMSTNLMEEKIKSL
jgi:hypothetical protein